jgi:hypothetical protein
VARKNDPEKVVVGPGQGVDVSGLGTPRSILNRSSSMAIRSYQL